MSLMKKYFFLIALICLEVKSSANDHIDAEFLYCKAKNDDLEYVLLVDTVVTDGVLDGNAGPQTVHFNWDPGIRVAIGYDWDCAWSIDLIGTYLHSNARRSINASLTASNSFLHTLWFQSFTGFRAASAKAEWNLDFATLDLIGTRIFTPWSCFTLQPYFGISSVWIKQKYEIDYDNILFTLMGGGTLPFPAADVNLFSRYLAVGLKVGTDFAIPLGFNFALNGNVSGSLVYGKSKVNERINGAFPIPAVDATLVPTHLTLPTEEWHLRANLESAASFSYTTLWKHHKIDLSAGYFFSIWFEQNDFFNLTFTNTNIVVTDLSDNLTTINDKHGDLQIQGLFLKATLYF